MTKFLGIFLFALLSFYVAIFDKSFSFQPYLIAFRKETFTTCIDFEVTEIEFKNIICQ